MDRVHSQGYVVMHETFAALNADFRSRLRLLPHLGQCVPLRRRVCCKLCDAAASLFDRVDFNKVCAEADYYCFGLADISVDYWRCEQCGFLFTDFFDGWSHDDFRAFVYNDDYAKVDGEYEKIRPTRMAAEFGAKLRGAEHAAILDYGTGSGVFVQCLRDWGFTHTSGYDPFSSPDRPEGCFDIIICCEVIEHAVDPVAMLADIVGFLKPDGCILFSQTLQPRTIMSKRGSWWYLAPRNGHVSTYTEKALEILGSSQGLLFHHGDTLHGFARTARSNYAGIALATIRPEPSILAFDGRVEGSATTVDPAIVMVAAQLAALRRRVAPPRSVRERVLRKIYAPLAHRICNYR